MIGIDYYFKEAYVFLTSALTYPECYVSWHK